MLTASDTWLFDHATLLRRFYEPIAKMPGHGRQIRYEDALANPVGYVATFRSGSVSVSNPTASGKSRA